jgi:hypothetical protein
MNYDSIMAVTQVHLGSILKALQGNSGLLVRAMNRQALVATGVGLALASLALLLAHRRVASTDKPSAPAVSAASPPPAPAPAGAVGAALAAVRARIAAIAAELKLRAEPTLVAVSKTKPAADVREAYDAGQRVFGENYVQEMMDKAPLLPADCRWHFIGHLQSNKAKHICNLPNLACVESVDSIKIADALDKGCATRKGPLSVYVQVNSSGEESKYGVDPSEALELVRHIRTKCRRLRCDGLMTIGALDYSPNPACLSRMVALRKAVAEGLALPEASLGLSMGMSADYEQAIRMGSTSVRVGSTIFGKR